MHLSHDDFVASTRALLALLLIAPAAVVVGALVAAGITGSLAYALDRHRSATVESRARAARVEQARRAISKRVSDRAIRLSFIQATSTNLIVAQSIAQNAVSQDLIRRTALALEVRVQNLGNGASDRKERAELARALAILRRDIRALDRNAEVRLNLIS